MPASCYMRLPGATASPQRKNRTPNSRSGPLHQVVRAVAFALKSSLQCDGVSIRQHNEHAGNQDVWHYHIHVTPRYHGDDLYARLLDQRRHMPAAERAEYAARLKAHLIVDS